VVALHSDRIPEPYPHHSFHNLPDCPAFDYLKSRPQWVSWKAVPEPGKKPRKIPIAARTGANASSSNPGTWTTYDECVQRTLRSQLAGVGYVLSGDDRLCAGDIDDCFDPESGYPLPWAQAIIDLAETYIEISPSGRGLRIFFFGDLPRAIKRNGVELYSHGRYLTVTGYQVRGTPGEIREAPRTLAAMLERAGDERPTPSPSAVKIDTTTLPESSSRSDYFRNVNSGALSSLSSWVPSLWPKSRYQVGTQAYRISSRDLGRDLEEDLSIAPNGIVDFGVHDLGDGRNGKRTPIDLVMEYGGAPDVKAAAEWLCLQLGKTPEHFGWGNQIEIDHAAIATILRQDDGTLIDSTTGEVIEDAPPQPPPQFPYPPGVVGDLAQWIVSTATRPQPLLSIGAALAIVGTVSGGGYVGPTRAATHLYILNVAPTGMGKDVPLRAIRTVLTACGLAQRVGPDEFTSMPAVVSLLHRAPINVCPMDEFGSFLKRINSKRASGFEGAVSKIFRTAWGCNFTDMVTPEYAQKASEVIHSPGMSIVGATTAEEFYQSIAAGDSSNGVLNRFLLLESPDKPARVVPEANPFVPPPAIVERLKAIHKDGATIPGDGNPDPYFAGIAAHPVRWTSPAAERVYLDILDRVEAMIDAEANEASYFARTGEMAVRIATIIAIGRRSQTVSVEDITWAASLAWWSAESMLRGVREHASENDHQANYKLVRGIVERAGEIGRNDLLRRVQGRVDARNLSGIISTLLESGEILMVSNPTKGRPKITYRKG